MTKESVLSVISATSQKLQKLKVTGVSPEMLESWVTMLTANNLDDKWLTNQLLMADNWLVTNNKVKRQHNRFFNNWLKIAINKIGNVRRPVNRVNNYADL